MNEWGTTMYPNNVCVSNENKKKAAEKALAAIQEALPDVPVSYGIVKDILNIAEELACYKAWSK